MYKLVSIIALLLGGIYFWNTASFKQVLKPCAQPIAYGVGTFDRRFGLSYSGFLGALKEAEVVFEKPLGKELFSYLPETGELKVNLIYDYRQETTKTLSNIGENVEENKATYDNLLSQFKALKARYDSDKLSYESLVADFNLRNEAYEQMVEAWNSGPRTSKKEFQELEEKRIELQSNFANLKEREQTLNALGREVNVLVDNLNRLASRLNLDVEQFNKIGAARGETFTGGLYTQSAVEKSIDIYEFQSREKLVRVLAHELGHALGLEHNDDPEAIMYHLNKGEVGTLTESDVTALKQLCGIEN